MAWCDLKDQIKRWTKVATVALRILFPSERRLCDRVFFSFSSAANLSFMEVCCGSQFSYPAKLAVPDGGLHPITRYVMNYLRVACRSRQTLEQVFNESIDDRTSSSSLSVQMAWIMELLDSNLEMKSRIYKDPVLCFVFMMNNGKYIVQKVKDSELGLLLGDDWIRKHTAKIRQYQVNYQKSSWNKVLAVLKADNTSLAPNPSLNTMRERLKVFNLHFDETCRAQSTWFIFDEQLREELRISVVENLSQVYRNFLGRLQSVPEAGKHPEKLIKYSVEEIGARVNGLFQRGGGGGGK
ncbi:hypothetical protein PVL29_007736 [Vitis rotundifolia]|uniref:Exocyst subunit Exo70 family protein n=1 Tax=Vitis rotundifolia TaxID=103349 RepID=A0AA39A0N5_VITRO|nr:hypothetical protein PVL29_007736 [Vitis rotundifolia]